MPSPLFQQLAHSQLELLANSLTDKKRPKIKSMALYLPQENAKTGQLEFLPAVLYPNPTTERIFIANDADSGVAPTLPPTLTKLPGFAHATTLLPGYPMLSAGTEPGIGVVEEVWCELEASGGTALSIPLLSGSTTAGVLLVSPAQQSSQVDSVWTDADRDQVARAAKSLSLALCMDQERSEMERSNLRIQEALADSLHQLKNPLQALRTYGKLLQQRVADAPTGRGAQLLELADHLMVQSERLSDKLLPVDSIVNSMNNRNRRPPLLYLNPAKDNNSLARWPTPALPWNNQVLTTVQKAPLNHVLARPTLSEPAVVATSTPGDNQFDMDLSTFFGDLRMEMTFVDEALEPVLSAFQAIAQDRSIDFVIDLDDELPGVMADARALQEAVSNLLDNAFKYVVLGTPATPLIRNPDPRVWIRLQPNAKPLAAGVTIRVVDNGPGVPQPDREAIFERGFRSAATARSVDGTGIGLGLARAIVEQMQGTLRLVPDEKRRTTMELALFRNVD